MTQPAAAAVFSLDALQQRAAGQRSSTVPTAGARPGRPARRRGRHVLRRRPRGELARTVDRLLAASERRPEDWPAAMVPHAGLHLLRPHRRRRAQAHCGFRGR